MQKYTNTFTEVTETMKDINYSLSLMSCTLNRKKFFGSGVRHVYIFIDKILFCKKPQKAIPDRTLFFNDGIRVQWCYDDQKPGILKAVQFIVDNNSWLYLGENDTLRQMKIILSTFIIQKRIQDEYKPQNILGRGSFAMVLEVKNAYDSKVYAGKCIEKAKLQHDENSLKSLFGEIEVMRMFTLHKHPQILQLKEVYEGENSYYLIMDMAEGPTLNAYIKSRQNLMNHNETKVLMRQVLSGLAHMHKFNVMHRDIKPDNLIFYESDKLESLKLVDFGLAINANRSPYLYPKCGTPGYIAPEILRLSSKYNGTYGTQCDVFSAGVIFFLMLTGEKPFKSSNKEELVQLNKECKFDQTKLEYCDNYARDLCLKMLDDNPSRRISSKDALRHPYFEEHDDLDQFSSVLFVCSDEEQDDSRTNNCKKYYIVKLFRLTNHKIEYNMFNEWKKQSTLIQSTPLRDYCHFQSIREQSVLFGQINSGIINLQDISSFNSMEIFNFLKKPQ